MNTPSEEQQLIIDHIRNGDNVTVNAVAGSGKSTTIISLALQLPNKNILQITYNSMLRHEMKDKVKKYDLPNLSIHTFHSLAVKFYSIYAHTDTEIRNILLKNIPPKIDFPKIDILTVDEAQDMSLLYFHFLYKFIKDMGEHAPKQVMILGDHQQCLYEFKGADSRFLTMSSNIWSNIYPFSNNQFQHCTLQTSYRITNPMANFVNKTMLGENRMLAIRAGEPVTYIRNSRYNIEKTVVFHIQQLLNSGVLPDDIFILAGSVKGLNSHIRKLENILVENNIPCHIPTIEQDKLDERVISGKIVFSTFHTVKGRQRKYVFIVGFDQSYFQTMGVTLNPTICPNTLYVGCTRATDGLFLLEFDNSATDRPLEFLKMSHHEMNACDFIKFKGTPQINFYTSSRKSESNRILRFLSPTKLIKFIPDPIMDEITPILNKIFICINHREPVDSENIDNSINIPNIIPTEYGFEDVSDLNGIAIPAMYYDNIMKKFNPNREHDYNVLHKTIQNCLLEMRENEHLFLKEMVRTLPTKCETIDDYLLLANIYVSIQERLYFKLKQIKKTEYDWISPEILEKCNQSLENYIGKECIIGQVSIEKTITHHSYEEQQKIIDHFLNPYLIENGLENNEFRFTAIVDMITPKSVWEIKCTTNITIDHQLQLVIYAWIWYVLDGEPKEFKIFNIKTGEIWLLNSTLDQLTNIIIAILRGKYMETKIKTDEEFLTEIYEIIDKSRESSINTEVEEQILE